MNAASFIHVTCWLVQNSNHSLDPHRLQQTMTDHLWSCSKIRVNRWKTQISELETNLDMELTKRSDAMDPKWLEFFSLAEEILLAESLTRVLFAMVLSKTDSNDVTNIARDVLQDNIETRKRVLRIIANTPAVVRHRIRKFNQLTKLNDHVTDLMLSQLADCTTARSFSLNRISFDEFANCAGPYRENVIRQANVALGLAFSNEIQILAQPTNANEDINRKIVDAIGELFDEALLVNFPGVLRVPVADAV